MTLFFFLLGYTFKYGASLKEFLKKRFFRTMIPYYIWAIVSIMIFSLMGEFLPFDITYASMFFMEKSYRNVLCQFKNNIHAVEPSTVVYSVYELDTYYGMGY